MTDRVAVGNLRVSRTLYDFITTEAIPGTGIDPDSFWAGVDKVVADLGNRNGEPDDAQTTHQPNEENTSVQQRCDRRVRTKPVQHTGQCKKKHEAIEAGNGVNRQHPAACRHKPRQHQRKKGKGHKKDVQHTSIVLCTLLKI